MLTGNTDRPLVWYMAAGYGLPAGIEAHILHYATEMRNHGFDTRVVVFKELPRERHRFLRSLEERGVPVRSLQAAGARRGRLLAALLAGPWWAYMRLRHGRRPDLASLRIWTQRRCGVHELRRLLKEEHPELIHIFGRFSHEACAHLPARRTIYHEMMTGTVDRYWNEEELAAFRAFAGRIARYFAPGSGVADNVRREFKITRRIDVIFTMCPDERNAERGTRNAEETQGLTMQKSGTPPIVRNDAESAIGNRQSAISRLRFGVICRLTEQKGISYLLEALKQYRDRHGDVHFTFGGMGPLEAKIREFANSSDLKNVSVVPVRSAVEILRDLDVFVHPSVDDAMPVAIAEALMCGVPCIACRVGGCADLVRDGQEGFVIEPRRTDGILEAMERFANMPAVELTGFRARARARYEAVCRPASVGAVVAEHYRAILLSLEV